MTLKEAYSKIDNTLCLNNNICNLQFNIDKSNHVDCKNIQEMTKALVTVGNAVIILDIIKKQFGVRLYNLVMKDLAIVKDDADLIMLKDYLEGKIK